MKTTILHDVLNLFYPDRCIGCSKHLSYHQKLICVACAHDLPYSYYSKNNWSPIEELFYGKIPIKFATSLLIYESKSITQKLIHELKKISKKNNWDLVRWVTHNDNIRAKSLYDRIAKKTTWDLYELK